MRYACACSGGQVCRPDLRHLVHAALLGGLQAAVGLPMTTPFCIDEDGRRPAELADAAVDLLGAVRAGVLRESLQVGDGEHFDLRGLGFDMAAVSIRGGVEDLADASGGEFVMAGHSHIVGAGAVGTADPLAAQLVGQ